jgi:hypothetical protein
MLTNRKCPLKYGNIKRGTEKIRLRLRLRGKYLGLIHLSSLIN